MNQCKSVMLDLNEISRYVMTDKLIELLASPKNIFHCEIKHLTFRVTENFLIE